MKNILQFLTVFCFVVMPVLTVVPTYASPAGQGAADEFGPEAVWDPFNETGGTEARECYYSTADNLDCVIEAMEEAGAPTQAVEFVKRTEGEAFLVNFSEQGPVDLGGMVYPGRANGNFQSVLLNGSPPLVVTDELPPITQRAVETHAAYQRVNRDNPGLMLWTWSGRSEGIQTLPLGWQRFLFSYPLKTCNACEVVETAFVAFDFNGAGKYLGAKTLFVTEDYLSGKDRLEASTSSSQGSDEELIAYFVENDGGTEGSVQPRVGSIWVVEPNGGSRRKVASLNELAWSLTWSPSGKFLLYSVAGFAYTHVILDLQGNVLYRIVDAMSDIAWAPQDDRLAYIPVSGLGTGEWTSQIHLLDVETGEVQQLTSTPTLKKHVEWDPNGERLAYTNIEGLFTVDLQHKSEEGLVEIPDGSPILWSPEGILFTEYDQELGQSVLNIVSPSSGEMQRLTSVPNPVASFLNIFPLYENKLCIACEGPSGICALEVTKQNPKFTVVAEGIEGYDCSWSPDGSQIVYSTGSYRNRDAAVHVMNTDNTNTHKVADGSLPEWRPIPTDTQVNIDSLLESKRQTIDALENTSVEVMGVPIRVRAFDETDARALIETLEERVDEDSLEDAQAEAFRRVVFQEEAVAEMLPLYTQASTDLTAGGTAMAGSLIVLNDRAEKIMSDAAKSPHRYTKAWWYLQRLVSRKILNVLDGLVKLTISRMSDETSQEDMRMFWDVLITGIRTNADTGVAVKDILLGTVVKQPVVNSVVGRIYVDRLQPSLDMGIRSTDLDYQGTDAWSVEGDAERAEIHIDSLARQAEMGADNAHQTHEALMEGVDRAQLVADLAELGELTPAAAAARVGKIFAQWTSRGLNATALVVAWNSMDCTYYLSTRAGPLAFDPNQPGESCRDRGSWVPPTTDRLASHRLRAGDVAAWNAATFDLEENLPAYQAALDEVLAAVRDESPRSMEEALVILDEVDDEVSQQMRNAVTLSLAQDEGTGNTDAIVEGQGQFASDALNFYLLTAAVLMEEEGQSPSYTEVKEAADAAVTSLDRFTKEFRASGPTVSIEAPIPTLSDVKLTAPGEGNKPFQVRATVENIGSAESGELLLKLTCDGEDVKARVVNGLEPNQEVEVLFECPRESSTVFIQLEEKERVADVRVKFFNRSHSATASNSVWQTIRNVLPSVCGCTAILFVVVLVVVGWIAKRR